MAYEKQNFKDGQVLTAEQLNRMEQYFQYCPQCYTEYGDEVVYLPETQATSDGSGAFLITDVIAGVIVGGIYIVKYNGVEYECTATTVNLGTDAIALGDASPMGGSSGNGEPFAVIILDADTASMMGAGVMINPLDGSSDVSISIVGREVIAVHKLNEAYLPEIIRFIVDFSSESPDNHVVKCSNYSAEELFALLESNKLRKFDILNGFENFYAVSSSVSMHQPNGVRTYYITFPVYKYDMDDSSEKMNYYIVKCTASEISYAVVK